MKTILFLHAGAELYGADIILYNLVTRLDKDKYKAVVVLPNDGPLVEKLRAENIICKIIDYPVLRRKYFNIKGILKYLHCYFAASKKIIRNISEYPIDIIHSNTSAILEGIYLKYKLHTHLVFHIHEILVHPKLLNRCLSKLFAIFGDKVVCVSKAVEDNLKKGANYKKGKLVVIHNGVDNNRFYPSNNYDYLYQELNIPKESTIIGMIGRVNAIKGQDDFLEAIKILFTKYDKCYALLVGGVFQGEEWRYEKLQSKIEQLNALFANRIRLVDFREDNFALHNFIDILVFPSVSPDSFPTVVLESMACKKPVVGYRNGGICEMIDNQYNGLLTDKNTPERLSENISELILDERYRNDLAQNAYVTQKQKFSIDHQIYMFENIYEQVILG